MVFIAYFATVTVQFDIDDPDIKDSKMIFVTVGHYFGSRIQPKKLTTVTIQFDIDDPGIKDFKTIFVTVGNYFVSKIQPKKLTTVTVQYDIHDPGIKDSKTIFVTVGHYFGSEIQPFFFWHKQRIITKITMVEETALKGWIAMI